MTNSDGTTSSCVYKTCSTASSSKATNSDCDSYFSDTNVKCTDNATKDAATGVINLSGCM